MIKLEQRRDLGRNQGPWELFLEKVRVPGIQCCKSSRRLKLRRIS